VSYQQDMKKKMCAVFCWIRREVSTESDISMSYGRITAN